MTDKIKTVAAGWPGTFCGLCNKKLTKEHLRNGLPSACPYCGAEDNEENARKVESIPLEPMLMERPCD